MFETIVNLLSPGALSNSTSLQPPVAAFKMARQTRPSLESAPPMLAGPDSDHNTLPHADEAIGVDFSGPLLTPEASRSETSSNNELVTGEEKPVLRRKSTRATRASLRGLDKLREADEDNEADDSEASMDLKSRTVSGETLVNSIAEPRVSRSSLRHSIAVMEKSWSQTTLLRDSAEHDDVARLDTPVSKESQESPGPSTRRRSLRVRPEKELIESRTPEKEQKTVDRTEKPSPARRSSRLSLVSKAAGMVDRATSVLGKRSRDAMEKTKEVLNRKASLRPRHSMPLKEDPAAGDSSQLPASKKRRVSESDLQTKKEELEKEDAQQAAPVAPRYKPKRWLMEGMYTGQDRNMDPRLNEANNKIKAAKRNAPVEAQRKYLPMPMFGGERLLKIGRDFKLPYDIFSPMPPGQPKPDEWRKVNKNVFVGDAASFWRENKNIELSTCLCDEDTGCDENCQNRYMFYECDAGNCRVGPNCGNRSFDELKQRTKAGGKYNVGVEVIKTMDRGYGVRSNRTFEPNQVIVEYTGEIITQGECERRMRTIYKNNECYYLMYFDQNMIIDATRGSIARFVNHSCEPNCRMEKWTVGGKPRMALFAGDKGVMTGEELTYDYNFDPFSQKNVQQCRCGAPTCRGVLGPRPKEQRSKEAKPDDKKKAKIQKKSSKATLAGTKRKIENVLDESTNRLNKKRKILTGKSVKRTIKQAVSKARATLSGKKGGVVQTKKNASVTKTNAKARSATTAKTKASKTTKRGGKTISKSKVTKVTTTKAKAKPTAKAKVYQIKSKESKVVAAPSSTGKAVKKPVSASEKVKTKLKATARRSTSFNKVTKPVPKSPVTKANAAAKEKKTPVKTPSRASSVKGGAKILR